MSKSANSRPKPPTRTAVIADKGRDIAAALEGNPIATLIGGLALGAAAGALLPRGEKEKVLLAPLGGKISAAAKSAIDAGREAGAQALDSSELSIDGLREQVSRLVGQAGEVASTAGVAAIEAVRSKGGKG